MSPAPRTSVLPLLLSALLLALPAVVVAKSADRNQPVYIDADSQDGDMNDNGINVWRGNVSLTQGTLKIGAAYAELRQRNGDPSLAVFTGKPVTLRQQLDDGTWMDAKADRIEYDLNAESIVLIGNYTIKSPKGSNSGQRMVYNTRTGGMQAGGDGSRVRTVIQPRSAQGKASTPADKP